MNFSVVRITLMPRTDIKIIRELGEGRHDCPFCGGTHSLSIQSNMGKLQWNCFRSCCTARGSRDLALDINDLKAFTEGSQGGLEDTFVMPEHWVRMNYDDPFVPDEWSENCSRAVMYGGIMLYRDAMDNRCIFQSGDNVFVGKARDHRVPKSMNYGDTSKGFRLTLNTFDTVVIVEDVLSCMNVWPLASTLALLGTTLRTSHMDFVLSHKRVLIALDPDALGKAMTMQKNLSVHVPTKVLNLTNDLKYFNYEKIKELIK